MPYHHDSIFGPGPRAPLDRDQRSLWRARLQAARCPGGITIAARDVGLAMLDMMGADGRLDPALEHLAAVVRVHLSTVQRAIQQLRAFGLLEWDRRLTRDASGVRQTSNAYRLIVADVQIAKQVFSKVCKKVRRVFGAAEDRRQQRIADDNRERQLAIIRGWSTAPS